MMKPTTVVSACLLLAACASTSDGRRVVTVAPAAQLSASNVNYSSIEASAACDTRKMRRRALDDDPLNDIASITVARELSPGRRTETDLDVNCRDYFARQLGANPRTIRAIDRAEPTPTTIIQRAVPAGTAVRAAPPVIEIRTDPVRRTVRVRRGDTLYGIAREHCTGWKTLARENGLRDAARISPGDVLFLPDNSC